MHIGSIKQYLVSPVKTPYFLFVSDAQYKSVVDELSVLGLVHVKMSSFCGDDDKLPDIDDFFSYIVTSELNEKEKKFIVTGLGEYLALRGDNEASQTLSRLKDFNIGSAKIVLILRGLVSQISRLETDPRFDNRRFSIVDNADCGLSFTLVAPAVGLSTLPGFKATLEELENGRCGRVAVSTAVNIDATLLTVHKIGNAHEGVKFSVPYFSLPRSCGSDTFWAQLLSELSESPGSLDDVFAKHGFSGSLESDFYVRIAGNDYASWLYFICLKCKVDTVSNSYLRFVLENTNHFEEFISNALNAIIEIEHIDKRFVEFYHERKALVNKFPESDIADFVVNNRKVVSESIYKLTDNTKAEREEIIAWRSQNGPVPQLEWIYPALAAYQKRYVFKCPELADLLTEYFETYKRQKLSNAIESEFLNKVDELAHSPRIFNRLPTRNEIINGLDKTGTYLYWLDALGVEYLAIIESLAQKRGLSIRVNIARAELPTITSTNRDFFDAWPWQDQKEKNDELDATKHSDKGGYNFINNELPIHLASELDIISAMIDKAATKLALRQCKRFLIVSDHGASRLAVLRRKEERYETDTKGEHSGRCCKLFQPYDLPFAAEENGYLVLADYGRFKGSRAANVEVHGGASLEEVVIPIIELSLKNERVTVSLVDDFVTVDSREGTVIKMFFNSPVQNISVVLNEKRYQAFQIDNNHYGLKLPDTKRAGEYPADVYTGDDLVGKIIIKTQGKSGKINDAFEDLFKG